MSYWNSQIERESDIQPCLDKSKSMPVLVYKHSNRCSVSLFAKYEVESLLESLPNSFAFSWVDVVANRPASLKLAELTSVEHESPQLLLLKGGQCIWNASHGDIRREKIEDLIREHLEESKAA